MTCDMRGQKSTGAICATHDTAFPFGGICPVTRAELEQQVAQAEAAGERDADYQKATRALSWDAKVRAAEDGAA